MKDDCRLVRGDNLLYTPKARMLNAYRGIFSDRYPVAPEFWNYYPAKVLGISMVELQTQVPHWKALLESFRRYGCEGWGCVTAKRHNPRITTKSKMTSIGDGKYRLVQSFQYSGGTLEKSSLYDQKEPAWVERYPVLNAQELASYVEADLHPEVTFDFTPAVNAFREVGDDYLLEFSVGHPFFDYIAGLIGFQPALFYFIDEEKGIIKRLYEKFLEDRRKLAEQAIENTDFESYFIGCSYSCTSLIGANMWREWDKPFIKEMADLLHKRGKLLHIHFHGKCMENLSDFVEMGVDCVCPFERHPGDVDGLAGLLTVRAKLDNKVTMNGNVHTIEALIKGTPDTVRQQVQEIKYAFAGSPRLVIGTGDQVGAETPEENLWAMIEEGRKINTHQTSYRQET